MSDQERYDIINKYEDEQVEPESNEVRPINSSERIIPFEHHNMPKVECFYHKGQYITNMCKRPECVIPLCPLCIHIHSNEHEEKGTYPQFESLEVLLNHVQYSMSAEGIKNRITIVNKLTNSYFEIQNHVSTFDMHSERTIKKIREIKARIFDVVEQFFSGLESEVYYRQKSNVVNQERDAKHLLKQIKERLDSMNNSLRVLNSVDCLQSVIPFYATTFHQDNETYYRRIHEYLNNFPTVSSDVTFVQSKTGELNRYLSSLIQVHHTKINDYLGVHQLPTTNIQDSRVVRPLADKFSPRRVSIPDKRIHYTESNRQSRVIPYASPQMGYSTGFRQSQGPIAPPTVPIMQPAVFAPPYRF